MYCTSANTPQSRDIHPYTTSMKYVSIAGTICNKRMRLLTAFPYTVPGREGKGRTRDFRRFLQVPLTRDMTSAIFLHPGPWDARPHWRLHSGGLAPMFACSSTSNSPDHVPFRPISAAMFADVRSLAEIRGRLQMPRVQSLIFHDDDYVACVSVDDATPDTWLECKASWCDTNAWKNHER